MTVNETQWNGAADSVGCKRQSRAPNMSWPACIPRQKLSSRRGLELRSSVFKVLVEFLKFRGPGDELATAAVVL
jgi:hypothetical protein